MTHSTFSVKTLGRTSKLQKERLKIEMSHDEVYADTWKEKISIWLEFVENDVLCTAFAYARSRDLERKIV